MAGSPGRRSVAVAVTPPADAPRAASTAASGATPETRAVPRQVKVRAVGSENVREIDSSGSLRMRLVLVGPLPA